MEDVGLILGWEDTLEEGMATHSSYFAWRIPMDRGAWWAACSPWRHKESDMTERLSAAQNSTVFSFGDHIFVSYVYGSVSALYMSS